MTTQTFGLDTLIASLLGQSEDLADRAKYAREEAVELLDLLGRVTSTDADFDPVLDAHLGGPLHRLARFAFADVTRSEASRLCDLAASLDREAVRLSDLATQLGKPAGFAASLPTPLLGVPAAAPQTEAEEWEANEENHADGPCERCGEACPNIAVFGAHPKHVCHQCFRTVPAAPVTEAEEAKATRLAAEAEAWQANEDENAPLVKIGLENGQTMMVPADDHAPAPTPAGEVATTAANSPAVLAPPAPLAPADEEGSAPTVDGDEADILAALGSPLTEVRLRNVLKVGKAGGMPGEAFRIAFAGLRKSGRIVKKSGKLSVAS